MGTVYIVAKGFGAVFVTFSIFRLLFQTEVGGVILGVILLGLLFYGVGSLI